MTQLYMYKANGVFQATPESQERFDALKSGEVFSVEAKIPRNINHHRLFFALMKLVFENQSHYQSMDHMITALKVALGHCDTVICKDGNPAYLPKSISFSKMDQLQFNEFWNRTLELVFKHFIPGSAKDREALEREVLEIVGG